MMMNMQSARLGVCFIVLATTSCGFPQLPELADRGDSAPPLDLELVAGDIGGRGTIDGPGVAAHFYSPRSTAVDGAGNVYVADCLNHTIRKITTAGVVTTLAGTAGISGGGDGTGAVARFYQPSGVAVDSAGNVYVADHYNHAIRKITAAGVVTTLAGTAGMGGSADGSGAAARFNQPNGVAVDSAGNIYVADTGNSTIRKVTAAGVVTTLAGTASTFGSTDGTGAAARFNIPWAVAVDSAGNVYVADTSNSIIRKVTAAGVVTTLAGTAGTFGSADGTGAAARFELPLGVAVDSAGNVYVADTSNSSIRKVTAAGVVTTLAGTAGMSGSADGTGAAARFDEPVGMAVDTAGNVYVADALNSAIRKVTATGAVTTLAGAANIYGGADGMGAAARFDQPYGVAVDSTGNIYVADYSNHAIRKVTAAGVVTTLAGTAGMSGSADGTGAAARFFAPSGVAIDSAGNVYVADTGNATIRKITAAGVVTTLAGTAGISGRADGTGAAARFYNPQGVAVDSAGNVYVADSGNNLVRKIFATGIVMTLAGSGGQASIDGTGAAAYFSHPFGVAVDSTGNVYVTDNSSNTIRKVTPAGVVTTLTGTANAVGSNDGIGAVARFNRPFGVAVDSGGTVYVADQFNSAIRKITSAGTTTTVSGVAGMAAVRLGAAPRFAFPAGLATTGDSIVISDANAILLLRHGAQ